ncbi:MAG: thioredoxin [Alphaproteobacteria bacterium]|nr:thioredoxin [Alphaproteobacteria bacterium]
MEPQTNLSPNAAQAGLIKDSTDRAFAADVIQESMNQPVIVDFWAPWCGPCKQLTPALEKAVNGANGAVKLVKINIDENPQIAGRLRVQSIPAVFAFRGGQPVDGFLGALPDSQVREFVKRLAQMAGGGASPVDDLLAAAQEALDAGEAGPAAQAFAEVLEAEPERAEAIAGLARCYLLAGDTAAARATLEGAPEEARKHEAVKAVEATLALAEKTGQAGDSAQLKAAVDANPADHQARYDYAMALMGENQTEAAMDELLAIVKRDRGWEDQKARKELLTLFEALGPADPLVAAGRRKLSTILFS